MCSPASRTAQRKLTFENWNSDLNWRGCPWCSAHALKRDGIQSVEGWNAGPDAKGRSRRNTRTQVLAYWGNRDAGAGAGKNEFSREARPRTTRGPRASANPRIRESAHPRSASVCPRLCVRVCVSASVCPSMRVRACGLLLLRVHVRRRIPPCIFTLPRHDADKTPTEGIANMELPGLADSGLCSQELSHTSLAGRMQIPAHPQSAPVCPRLSAREAPVRPRSACAPAKRLCARDAHVRPRSACAPAKRLCAREAHVRPRSACAPATRMCAREAPVRPRHAAPVCLRHAAPVFPRRAAPVCPRRAAPVRPRHAAPVCPRRACESATRLCARDASVCPRRVCVPATRLRPCVRDAPAPVCPRLCVYACVFAPVCLLLCVRACVSAPVCPLRVYVRRQIPPCILTLPRHDADKTPNKGFATMGLPGLGASLIRVCAHQSSGQDADTRTPET